MDGKLLLVRLIACLNARPNALKQMIMATQFVAKAGTTTTRPRLSGNRFSATGNRLLKKSHPESKKKGGRFVVNYPDMGFQTKI